MENIDQISIIGTGLLGTSLGLALKAQGYRGRIVGVGRRRDTVERARAMGGIDVVSTDPAAAVSESGLAVVAVPVGAFAGVFQAIAPADHDALVVTDVGSIKQAIVAAAREILPRPQRFVGAHPMAGSEQDGPEAARADLFAARPCILTPEATSDGDAVAAVEQLWARLGMRILWMDAAEHDRQAALVSHLPHVVAGLLIEAAGQRGGWEVASSGFCDATRLAGGQARMWADILSTNRQQVAEALRFFGQRAEALARLIETGRHEQIAQWLGRQKDRRDTWVSGKIK